MKVGISACSNGLSRKWEKQNDELMSVLREFGAEPVLASHIYASKDEFSGTDEERAADLMELYRDDSIAAIYDISGGDLDGLFGVSCSFLQGEHMEGVVVGGNIRCFTKLAGTKYWPDMNGKILLLESLGGGSGQVATMFAQLEQIGVFDQVAGVLLGTFTNYEKADLKMTVYDLLKMHIDEDLPVAVTGDIGHGHDSKAIVIGKKTAFEKHETNI